MDTKEIRDILVEIDTLLSRATVNGENLFYLCDSRRLLKAVFDMIPAPPPVEKTKSKKKESETRGG